MFEFRVDRVSLFLMQVLQITAAVHEQHSPYFVVRLGDDVTLPCENVIDDHEGCNRSNWIFSGSGSMLSFMLVDLGQIVETYKSPSDRLSVAESCSLVIRTVTVEDVGRYTCREFGSEQDAHVHLSVVKISPSSSPPVTEQKDAGLVTLNCSVLTYEWCTNTVEWLYEPCMNIITTSQSECSAAVTFPTRRKKRQNSEKEFFMCNVTDGYTGEVQLFDFTPPGAAPPITQEGLWRIIIVSVGLAGLIITVVAVNIWTRSKGNRTRMDGNAVHNDEDEDADEGTVTYENVGEPSASIRLH